MDAKFNVASRRLVGTRRLGGSDQGGIFAQETTRFLGGFRDLAHGMRMLRFTKRTEQHGLIATDLPFRAECIRIVQDRHAVAGQHFARVVVAQKANGRTKVAARLAFKVQVQEFVVLANDNIVVIVQIKNVRLGLAGRRVRRRVEWETRNGCREIAVRALLAVDVKVVAHEFDNVRADANCGRFDKGINRRDCHVRLVRGTNVNIEAQSVVKVLVFEEDQVAFPMIRIGIAVPQFDAVGTTIQRECEIGFGVEEKSSRQGQSLYVASRGTYCGSPPAPVFLDIPPDVFLDPPIMDPDVYSNDSRTNCVSCVGLKKKKRSNNNGKSNNTIKVFVPFSTATSWTDSSC
jgi:hypothetical protein